ncbi:MAG: NUDIX hydrolase [Eubacterium sp.]|nr:NUDIX hydrolase [Eubacterium sp.]
MKLFEKTVASQEIYSGRILNLRVDEVALPDGAHSMRELVDHKDGVAVLPVKGDRIVFVRQFRKAIERVILEIPAGLVEAGENPEAAAVRELQEEINLKPLELFALGKMWPSPGFCNEVTTLYLATEFTPSVKAPDDDEFIEIVEMPIRTVRALYLRGMFSDAKTACALGRFFSMM